MNRQDKTTSSVLIKAASAGWKKVMYYETTSSAPIKAASTGWKKV